MKAPAFKTPADRTPLRAAREAMPAPDRLAAHLRQPVSVAESRSPRDVDFINDGRKGRLEWWRGRFRRR
jgi:hypothetical protein